MIVGGADAVNLGGAVRSAPRSGVIMMEKAISNIYSKPIRYLIAASIWNITCVAALLFIGSFFVDIASYLTGNTFLGDNAYVVAFLSTPLIFWGVCLALLIGLIVKCDHCGARLMNIRGRVKLTSENGRFFKLTKFITLFAPFASFSCPQCNTAFKIRIKCFRHLK